MWFWTAITDEAFYIMKIENCILTSGGDTVELFSIGV